MPDRPDAAPPPPSVPVAAPHDDRAGSPAPRTSRLAPSPTGALHVGNARTFLANWALARGGGWTLRLRIEDIDSPRVKPGAIDGTRDLLDWLGLDHDGPDLVQTDDIDPYLEAIRRLSDGGRIFACDHSRRDVEQAASAPHADDGAIVYPPSLRPLDPDAYRWTGVLRNHRFLVDDAPVAVEDRFAGRRIFDLAAEGGDFLVWTRRGLPSYQLAVVVDDLRQGVTDVVRGDDLLASAARQQRLHEALGHAPPTWWHLPLVIGPDGRRLAKRHGDTRLDRYRDLGVRAERVIGLVAAMSGIGARTAPAEMDAAEFLERFAIDRLPREPVRFTAEDDAWLTAR